MKILTKSRGFKVRYEKLTYLNVDSGTMSPFQHGEVCTDDGKTDFECL